MRYTRQSLLLAAVWLGISLVAGQLLSETRQPIYYVDQVVASKNEGQDPVIYLSDGGDQLAHQSLLQPIDDIQLGYQSSAGLVDEALLRGQLLSRLHELRRELRPDGGEEYDYPAIVGLLNRLKQSQRSNEKEEQEEEENEISAPINNPVEFLAAAKLLQQLPMAANNGSSVSDGLISLESFVSSYLGNLAAKEGESGEPRGAKLGDQDHLEAKKVAQQQQQQEAPKEPPRPSQQARPPANRYGSAEYIDHPLAIIGHQYVQGGAGEGKQLLGPEGTFENVQVIKTDKAVPSYCDPPNPCPIGFTAEDGCLENFVNSASSSREYQAKQQCSCDNEHSLFNCASPISSLKAADLLAGSESAQVTTAITSSRPNELAEQQENEDTANDQDNGITDPSPGEARLETLARTIHNRFGSLSSIRNLLST